MIHFLIGHRGAGKTTLLKRIEIFAREGGVACQTFDLDAEIERLNGQTVNEIFERSDEIRFRELEAETLNHLLRQVDSRRAVWIALGAGFRAPLPEDSRKIWVRRTTDGMGRVFLDRPRLEGLVSPFDEYMKRYEEREVRYREIADEEITLPEGFAEPSLWESALLGFSSAQAGGVLTVLPEKMKNLNRFREFINRKRKLSPDAFELRDDLISPEQMRLAREVLDPKEVIYSFRKSIRRPTEWSEAKVDWALELGLPEGFKPEILSLHERHRDLTKTLKELPRHAGVLKLAVEIRTFNELLQGHRWWQEDPVQRSFLPRSREGRWNWYRLLFGKQMPIAFWREGEGSAFDQPLLAEWLKTPKEWAGFAAILGAPVVQSFTPAEQGGFFGARGMPVVAIRVSDEDWGEDTLKVLSDLGLRAAAVTSPLKEKSTRLASALTETARELKSVNTLVLKKNHWHGHNTDIEGLKALAPGAGETCVWGGGGTREVIKRVFSDAAVFSARTGVSERGNLALDFAPETVVWAVGRSRMPSCRWPPKEWAPKLIIDLNYTEDSPGREYALMTGANYQGGLPMFKAQAAAQREFWRENL